MNWQEALWSTDGPWIHRTDVEPVVTIPEDGVLARLDSSQMRDFDGLMREFARELRFPAYFGGNWPALNECLRDLGWMQKGRYLLVIHHADNLLSEEPAELPVLWRVLDGVGRYWSDAPGKGRVPFHVLVVPDERAVP